MMHRNLWWSAVALVFTSFLSAQVALADAGLAWEGAGTKLDQLIQLYNDGTTPSTEDVLGKWSGRSFFKATPDTPGGAYLMCEMHREDLGPLFPEENLGCYTSSYLTTNTDYYDSGDKIDTNYAKKQLVKVVIETTDNGLCYDTTSQDYGEEYKGQICIKKYNDYLIYLTLRNDVVIFGGYFYIKF